ncbi:TIGR02710 family CRISPR-associated protein [Candidatus Bathyarchaeota archaeon]|nr:TIGR02710 family CRISPR-associated protein [Candidatus Bathyarchaeota archaeon]
MKALVISVGTGTRASRQSIRSLAEAIVRSIRHHNPDKTYLVVTKESMETTVPEILPKIKPMNYELIQISNPDNIQSIYEELRPRIKEIREQYENLTIDYTSGTKAMTAGLAVLATIFSADELSYITGKRKAGIVQPGTEQIVPIRPYFIVAEQKMREAIRFFNRNQFSATITILEQTRKTIMDPKIIEQTTPLLQLAKAYEQWDKFHHEKAFKTIKKIKMPELAGNKQFLGQLISNLKRENGKPEPYYIADLINNAERRAEESKYDDAVARLYRTIELIAQYRLRKNYGIDPSNAETEKIPQNLMEKWNIPKDRKTVKLALNNDYELLDALGDPLGQKYLEDRKLKNLLLKRNASILAHGQTPVTKQTYIQLHKKTIEYAETTIKNLKQLMENSKFIKWKEMGFH